MNAILVDTGPLTVLFADLAVFRTPQGKPFTDVLAVRRQAR